MNRNTLAAVGRRIPFPHGRLNVCANTPVSQLVAELSGVVTGYHAESRREIANIKSRMEGVISKITALSAGPGGPPMEGTNTVLEFEAFGCLLARGQLTDEVFAAADFSVTPDREGGFTAPAEIDRQVQRRLRDVSAMRRVSEVRLTTAGEYQRVLNLNGTDSGWVGEKDSRPQTSGDTFAKLTVPVFEQYAMPAITQTLIDDSFMNVAEEVTQSITDAFNDQEGAAFITGNGVGKPKGFLSYSIVSTADATRSADELQYVPSGASGAFPDVSGIPGAKDADALLTMVYTLRAPYRNGANWLMNSATALVISKLKDGENRYIWKESMAAGQPATLHGYPVEIDEGMPDIDADAYPVAFGNFRRGYLIVDRQGIRLVRDPYSAKPYVLFYTTKRVGGSLTDNDAIKVLKMTTN